MEALHELAGGHIKPYKMRPRIVLRIDIQAYLQEQRRRQWVYGTVVRMTSDECDLSWADAKKQVNKNLKERTLWHLLRNC